MVNPKYIGNRLQKQMQNVHEDYAKEQGFKYIFTKVCKYNTFSVDNIINDGYHITNEYENERGMNLALLKKINWFFQI